MWLREFQEIVELAGARLDDPDIEVRIDDPQYGPIGDEAPFDAYITSTAAWLRERDARPRRIATTVGPTRALGEFEVELSQDGRTFSLPVAVVVEPDRDLRRLAIRVYHSQWPLLGHHVIRLPLLAKDPTVRESDVVGEYQAALAAGDVERIVATFEPDGCFREPAGGEFRVCGTTVLRELFSTFFGVGGGITLEHCTATEDGVRTALEFNAVRWGSTDMTPQAGVAVYERGRTGKIAEARIYDDVDPPLG
jgi:hypothetical protein